MLKRLFRSSKPVQSAISSVFDTLEGRQLMAAVPLYAKIKVTNPAAGDGTQTNSSLVEVKFSEKVTLLDASKFRLFGYGLKTETGTGTAQKKITINVVNPTVDSFGNKITFSTDRKVRKGARLIFYAGAFSDQATATANADITGQLPKGLNKERFTLTNRAFAPTVLGFFNQSIYSGAPAVTAAGSTIATNTVTTNLTNFLQLKVDNGFITAAQKTAALARYNSTLATTIIPNANLRAALISTVGTIGEPAIASILDGVNSTGKAYSIVDFSSSTGSAAVVAETSTTSSGRLRITLKTAFTGDRFESLGAILAHEIAHQDLATGQSEELFTNTVETMVYAQQLLANKAIAQAGTQLVTDQNLRLLALLNSGDQLFPRVGTLQAPLLGNGNIFPNGNNISGGNYVSFDNYIRRVYQARGFNNVNSPGNAQAVTESNNILLGTETATFEFSAARISLFDAGQQIITDKAAVKLATALKLKVA